jgi:hypothetical protein
MHEEDLPPMVALRDPAWGEPRVRDIDLGVWLGLTRPSNIRNLIRRNDAELLDHGPLLLGYGANLLHGEAKSRGRGRPSPSYWLNQAQALALCALSQTDRAIRVRGMLIRVFLEGGGPKPMATPVTVETAPEVEDLPDLTASERNRLNFQRGVVAGAQAAMRDIIRQAHLRSRAMDAYEEERRQELATFRAKNKLLS